MVVVFYVKNKFGSSLKVLVCFGLRFWNFKLLEFGMKLILGIYVN